MLPKNATAIDDLFVYVLDVLDDVRHKKRQPKRAEVGQEVVIRLHRIANSLGDAKQFDLIKYAFACWIDEVFVEERFHGSATWAATWKEHVIEQELFGEREASTKFFREADEAAKLADKDALEVFVTCVMLGFRGMCHVNRDMSRADVERHEDYLNRWIAEKTALIKPPKHDSQLQQDIRLSFSLADKTRVTWLGFLSVLSAIVVSAAWIWFLLLA